MRPLTLATCLILFGAFGAAFAQTPTVPVQAAVPFQPDKNSTDYRSGLADGCMHATNGLPRNDNRYLNNATYHWGWNIGFSNCYPHQTINTNGDPNGPLKNIF